MPGDPKRHADKIDPFVDPSQLPCDEGNGEQAKARLLDRYVSLRDTIRAAETELEEVKDLLRGFLDDGELVSNGDVMASYSIRRTYEYNVAAIRQTLPRFFDFACSIDTKRATEAIRMGLASEQQLDPLREVKEIKALIVKAMGNGESRP